MEQLPESINNYLNYIKTPWGKLFYEIVLRQLELMRVMNKNVLDFGSGFGITADRLAENNTVTAVEPNEQMTDHRSMNNDYTQIVGGIEKIKEMPDKTFDVIICHNVLEYVSDNERREFLSELHRVLKPDGFISIIHHNRNGKIMQKVVYEYNTEEATDILRYKDVDSLAFGTIRIYDHAMIPIYSSHKLKAKRRFGIRTFYALQINDIKYEEDWFDKMLKIELAVCEIEDFRNVSFFNHLILVKSDPILEEK